MSERVRTAVVPVAGRGTRLGPLTKVVPKELFPLGRHSVLEHIVAELSESGITKVVLVSSPQKPLIERFVDEVLQGGSTYGVDVSVVLQGPIDGNGGAILSAADALDSDPFLVVWGDEVFLGDQHRAAQVLDAYAEHGVPSAALVPVVDSDVRKCGIALTEVVEGRLLIRDVLEKPDPRRTRSRLASVGGVVVDAALVQQLRRTRVPAGEELYLSAALSAFARTNPVLGVALTSTWYETGSFEGYASAFRAVAAQEGLLGRDDSAGSGS